MYGRTHPHIAVPTVYAHGRALIVSELPLAHAQGCSMLGGVASLRDIHAFMYARRRVMLQAGQSAKIVRVDTEFPKNETTVTVWVRDPTGSTIMKVPLSAVLCAAKSMSGEPTG